MEVKTLFVNLYTDGDREQTQSEIEALKSEVDRISTATTFNGIQILDGTQAAATSKADAANAANESLKGATQGTTKIATTNAIAAITENSGTAAVTTLTMGASLAGATGTTFKIGEYTFRVGNLDSGSSKGSDGVITFSTSTAASTANGVALALQNAIKSYTDLGDSYDVSVAGGTTANLVLTANNKGSQYTLDVSQTSFKTAGTTSAGDKLKLSFDADKAFAAGDTMKLSINGNDYKINFYDGVDDGTQSDSVARKTINIDVTKSDSIEKQLESIKDQLIALDGANFSATSVTVGAASGGYTTIEFADKSVNAAHDLTASIKSSDVVATQTGKEFAAAVTSTEGVNQSSPTGEKAKLEFTIGTIFESGESVVIQGKEYKFFDSSKGDAGEAKEGLTYVDLKDKTNAAAQATALINAIAENDPTISTGTASDYKITAAGSVITIEANEKGAKYTLDDPIQYTVDANGKVDGGNFTAVTNTVGIDAISSSQAKNATVSISVDFDKEAINDGSVLKVGGQNFTIFKTQEAADAAKAAGSFNGTAIVADNTKDILNQIADAFNTQTDGKFKDVSVSEDGKTITFEARESNKTALALKADTKFSFTAGADPEIAEAKAEDFEGGVNFQIGANGNDDQRVELVIDDMGTEALGIADIDLTTIDGANAAIDIVDAAINTVSAQRANLGAMQNRLEHTINNLDTNNENLTAAESRIRDVDMANEMMKYTQNNVLVQAAQSMLAQANQQPQSVLSLLQ